MEFKVIYDRSSDVLYITTPHHPAYRGIEDEFGLIWRFDRDGRTLGCTVMDFADYWYPARRLNLVSEIAKNLDVPSGQVEGALANVAS
jgi:hypothetical protein